MKKVIAIVLTVALLAIGLGASAAFASPGIWEMNPGTEVSVTDDTITLGVSGAAEGDYQPEAVHGATIELPPAEQIYVEFNYDLYTWDSYNEVGTPNPPWWGGTGYWDAFSISVSQDKYWNLSLSDPLDGDPLDVGFLWGGASYGDGFLESTSGSGSATMAASTASTNYLNVVLDTLTEPEHNGNYPSWGTIEITKLEILGVPSVTKELVEIYDANENGVVEVGEPTCFWLRITVTNNTPLPISSVTVKDRLGGDLMLDDWEMTTGTLDTWTKGKSQKVFLTWENIGTLAPGQSEILDLLVCTDINPGTGNSKKPGHQEYTEAGTHCLNSGATAKGLVELASGVWEVSDTADEICIEVVEPVIDG